MLLAFSPTIKRDDDRCFRCAGYALGYSVASALMLHTPCLPDACSGRTRCPRVIFRNKHVADDPRLVVPNCGGMDGQME